MVTFLDFIHFRSTRGLARRCRRYARRLMQLMAKLEHDEAMARDDAEQGESELVFKDWEKIFEDFKEEENLLDIIDKNEKKIIYSENEREKDLENYFENHIMKNLDDNMKGKLNDVLKMFKELDAVMSDKLTNFRIQDKDLYEKRVDRIRVALMSNESYDAYMRRESQLESRQARFVKTEEKDLKRYFGELERCIKHKASPQEFEKVISEIHTESERLKNDFLKEIEYMTDVLTYAYNLHLRMFKELFKDVPEILAKLEEEGMDMKLLAELKVKEGSLEHYVTANLDRLFQMGRYEERHYSTKFTGSF